MNTVVAAVVAILMIMSPVKSYVKPGEPVEIRFAQSQASQTAAAAKMVELAGLKAVQIPELFQSAAAGDVVDSAGRPVFKVYQLAAQKAEALESKGSGKVDANGVVDVSAFYPQIKEVGTYILTWKGAPPLVISTLRNPEAKAMLEQMGQQDMSKLPPEMKSELEPVAIHIVPLEYAVISTDKGDIKATFAYDVAPNTIENFTTLAKENFYDGTVFHRIIKGFMIQGGDSVGTSADRAGTGGPGHSIVQEFSNKPHERGVLSMARSQSPDSAGSQFFIMHAAQPHLNGGYTAFGQVIEGMDVVDKIATTTPVTDTNGSTKPADRPVIKSLRILPATAEMYGIK